MSGGVGRGINDKCYFIVDEVGGSSGTESEYVTDDELMSGSKNEAMQVEELVKENNSNTRVISDAGNIVQLKGYELIHVTDNVNNPDTGIVKNVNSPEQINPESELSSGTSIEGLEVSLSSNMEPINMDIVNDSDGEIGRLDGFEDMKPIIKISFRDEKIEKMYKSSILRYLEQELHTCVVVQSSENSFEVEIYDKKRILKDEDVLDFHLDTTPNLDLRNSRIPSYGKNNDVLLTDLHTTIETNIKQESSPVCFNCSGSHVLRDCPHERNMKEIIKNRNKFQSANKVQKASRYHLDENQKYGHLVPGELTNSLRNALNLHKDQQPLFIYRMRLLGYPPAWLEEARVSHSGVAIYDQNGVPVSEEDEEEGEIIPEGAKDRFDISKIIEFPGFNVPLEKNMKEEGNVYCCPGLSVEQSKENMIKILEPNAVQAYKKRSFSLQKYSSQEMSPKPEKRLTSPTIEEMEEKKRQLLMALNDEDITDLIEKGTDSEKKDNVTPQEVTTLKETSESNIIKTLDYGTPILKSISPYSKLPPREQFSVNVSDVINFENLPNSTGKYESMSCLIHKIRNTVTKIQNE